MADVDGGTLLVPMLLLLVGDSKLGDRGGLADSKDAGTSLVLTKTPLVLLASTADHNPLQAYRLLPYPPIYICIYLYKYKYIH